MKKIGIVRGLGPESTLYYYRTLIDLCRESEDLRGNYRYYEISGNIAELKAFYKQVVRLAFKWLNRRSQKRSYNWTQFHRFLNFNPLPKPKIYHLIYTLSSQQGCITEEPCAGNLHAGFCEGH